MTSEGQNRLGTLFANPHFTYILLLGGYLNIIFYSSNKTRGDSEYPQYMFLWVLVRILIYTYNLCVYKQIWKTSAGDTGVYETLCPHHMLALSNNLEIITNLQSAITPEIFYRNLSNRSRLKYLFFSRLYRDHNSYRCVVWRT